MRAIRTLGAMSTPRRSGASQSPVPHRVEGGPIVAKRRTILFFIAMLSCMALVIAACGGGDEAATDTGSEPAAQGPVQDPTSPVTITFAGHVGQEPQWKKMA